MPFSRLFALCLLLAGASVSHAGERVHVAVASNFLETMRQLAGQYQQLTGVEVRLSAGSTGKLYAQIRNGLPAQLFLAADEQRPMRLIDEGLALASSRWTYALGELVFWGRGQEGSAEHCRAWLMDSLAGNRKARLAVANPRTAPYGAAALAVLRGLKLERVLAPQLVQGENIAQTYLFVDSGAAMAGFVARAQILAQPSVTGCQWQPPAGTYPPLRQDGVILNRGQSDQAVHELVAWVRSDTARAMIRAAGYRLP